MRHCRQLTPLLNKSIDMAGIRPPWLLAAAAAGFAVLVLGSRLSRRRSKRKLKLILFGAPASGKGERGEIKIRGLRWKPRLF